MFQYTMWMLVHPTHLVLSSATLSSKILCCSFISGPTSCCLCAFHNSGLYFTQQPQEQKSGRRQLQGSNALFRCQYIQLIWGCPLQPFQIRYFVVLFWSKILLFVCLPQQQIVFYSTTTGTKKWQKATTIFQYTIGMLVHPAQKVLSSATLSNEIFCGSSLVINHFVCVPSATADCNLFNNHRNKNVVKGNYNVLVYYCNTS